MFMQDPQFRSKRAKSIGLFVAPPLLCMVMPYYRLGRFSQHLMPRDTISLQRRSGNLRVLASDP